MQRDPDGKEFSINYIDSGASIAPLHTIKEWKGGKKIVTIYDALERISRINTWSRADGQEVSQKTVYDQLGHIASASLPFSRMHYPDGLSRL